MKENSRMSVRRRVNERAAVAGGRGGSQPAIHDLSQGTSPSLSPLPPSPLTPPPTPTCSPPTFHAARMATFCLS